MDNNQPATYVEIEVYTTPSTAVTPEEFHTFADGLMDEFVILEAADDEVSDIDVASEADRAAVTVSMTVLAGDPLLATIKASTIVRTAIHAVGGATPGWPDADDIKNGFQLEVRTENVKVPADC